MPREQLVREADEGRLQRLPAGALHGRKAHVFVRRLRPFAGSAVCVVCNRNASNVI
jgi:hypothetical protein